MEVVGVFSIYCLFFFLFLLLLLTAVLLCIKLLFFL